MRTHISAGGEPLSNLQYAQPEPWSMRGLVNTLPVGRKWKARPVGLWYSMGADWTEHLEKEYEGQPIQSEYAGGNCYTVAPSPECKLFVIDSVKQLHLLNALYPEVAGDDWRRLANDYDGLELLCLEELESLASDDDIIQEHYDWLSKMEINSGCIWNLTNVSLHLLPDIGL